MSLFDKSIQQQMISTIWVGRNNSHRVQVTAAVGHNGVIFEDVVVPHESLTQQVIDEAGNSVILSTINVSQTACKVAELDEETGDFVFNVAYGGKSFTGCFKPGLITAITTGGKHEPLPINQCYPYYLAAEINKLVNDPDLMVVPEKMDGNDPRNPKKEKPALKVVSDVDTNDFDADLPRPNAPFNPRIAQ